jgi:glycosyltransferase involved in cell wall biosynthesis
MKNIILDCDLMKHPNSGLYHYCLNLGNYVNDELDHRHEKIKYYVPPAEANTFERKENAIVEKTYHKFFRPFLSNCAVWHAPFQSGRVLPRPRKGLKILLTIHDLNPLHEGKSETECKQSLAHTQSLINQGDAMVCISEFTKSDVLKYCDVGDKPVYVIHNGTHKVAQPEIPKSYQPRRPFIFGMGYVNRKKNYHVLLSLVQNSDIELVIAGRLDEADYIEGIEKEAERLGVSDRVHLTGPIPEGEKSWYLRHCTAFMHPSLAEGFGAPVVEAMQFGKPLFLSDRTSLPEIGGDVAFYFSNFEPDHMREVLNKGLEKYSQNGLAEKIKRRAQQFNWQEKALEYLKVYRSLY